MVKVTIDEAIDFANAYEDFSQQVMPLRGAYKMSSIYKQVQEAIEIYREQFNKIIEKYGEKDKDGNFVYLEEGSRIKIKEDQVEECGEAMEEISKDKIEINNYDLSIDQLGENMTCKPEEMQALVPFITEKEA